MTTERSAFAGAPVWGRDDLTCPVPTPVIRRLRKYAFSHPWPGNRPLMDPRHVLDTRAITEPGRPTRILFSLDVGYHSSGWFANSDYDRCLHLSVSHPRIDRPMIVQSAKPFSSEVTLGYDLEAPTDEEVRAWGLVFFREHATIAWFEPAVGPLDPHRTPGVVHLRLYVDKEGRPFMPVGEVYHLRPWADGSSPAKVVDGRLGADVQ